MEHSSKNIHTFMYSYFSISFSGFFFGRNSLIRAETSSFFPVLSYFECRVRESHSETFPSKSFEKSLHSLIVSYIAGRSILK